MKIEEHRQLLQEEAISNVSDYNSRMTPVVTREDAERDMAAASKEDLLEGQIGLLNERFAGLEGHLFGRDGTNGAFGELRSDIKALSMTVDQMHADVHCFNEQRVADNAKVDHELIVMRKDIDAVGEIARSTRDGDRDTRRRFKAALVGLGVTAAGAAIWAGVQTLL